MIAPATFALPAFDPEHEDAEILEAFEKVRSRRVDFYSQYDRAPTEQQEAVAAAFEAGDDYELANEMTVLDTWAATPAGVSAQLLFALFVGGNERWIDRGLMEQGLRALHVQRSRLDGRDQIIVQAAFELLHIEFEHAFADWKKSNAIMASVNKLRSDIETVWFARRASNDADEVEALLRHAERLVRDLSDMPQLAALARTLAPDWACYRRKAEIMIAEEYGHEAGPWLLRDVNFLMGEITVEPATAEAA